jgi:hypothetical protein
MSDQDDSNTDTTTAGDAGSEQAQGKAADGVRPPQPEAKPAKDAQDDGRAKALAEERRRSKAAEARAEALEKKVREFEDLKLSEQEKVARDLAEAKAAAEAAKAEAARFQLDAVKHRIAAEKGVPAGLLAGEDEEALTASADAALAWRGQQAPTAPTAPKPDPSVGARGGGDVKSLDSGAALYDMRHPKAATTA